MLENMYTIPYVCTHYRMHVSMYVRMYGSYGGCTWYVPTVCTYSMYSMCSMSHLNRSSCRKWAAACKARRSSANMNSAVPYLAARCMRTRSCRCNVPTTLVSSGDTLL